ncbi:HAD-IIB family hydrolase [Aquicoccus sp. SU-CL01552]|uniref:HAD-IIB family hydrolase n=1 Tax=Aquicoccus sp. SU-CL01552 TaxID=3127656 RepID=UPI0031051159
MTAKLDLLVFSDLDGTLLSHHDYKWTAAEAGLRALRRLGAGVILATSKTAAEVAPLRAAIGFADWPAIVENGGGLLEPGQTGDADAGTYAQVRARLATLPRGFRGFGDMTATEIAAETGLATGAAADAKVRQYSEPGLWNGSEEGLARFLEAASAAGLTARRGGRFLSLSLGGTKADRMDALLRRYAPRHSIALGDAPNDVEMLERAEYGVIVRNDHSSPLPPLAGEDSGRIRRTAHEGPQGWAEAISALLQDLKLTKEPIGHG